MQDWEQRENKTKVNERDIELDKQHRTIVEEQEGDDDYWGGRFLISSSI